MTRLTGAERQARARARRQAGIPPRRGITPLADRFWTKVDKRGPDECWPWTAATNDHGYGVLRPETTNPGGPTLKAHRASLMLHGIDPTGHDVLHSLGTAADNARDRVERGRGLFGSRSPMAKLTEADVVEIRRRVRAKELHRIIAADFGVSRSRVTSIASGNGWAHVADEAIEGAA